MYTLRRSKNDATDRTCEMSLPFLARKAVGHIRRLHLVVGQSQWFSGRTAEERRLHVGRTLRHRLFSLSSEGFVDIRLISSLTDNDEDRFAHVLLKAVVDLLNKMPITYLVRIETSRGKVFKRSRSGPEASSSPLTVGDGSNPRL